MIKHTWAKALDYSFSQGWTVAEGYIMRQFNYLPRPFSLGWTQIYHTCLFLMFIASGTKNNTLRSLVYKYIYQSPKGQHTYAQIRGCSPWARAVRLKRWSVLPCKELKEDADASKSVCCLKKCCMHRVTKSGKGYRQFWGKYRYLQPWNESIWELRCELYKAKYKKTTILSFIKDKIVIFVANFIYKRYESNCKTELSWQDNEASW